MMRGSLIAFVACFALQASVAEGQTRRAPRGGYGGEPMAHRAELSGLFGYNWQSSYGVFFQNVAGEVDAKSSENWGVELDVNARPGTQLVLLYNRMDTQALYTQTHPNRRPEVTLGDLAVEYYHVGALGGPKRGNMLPYGGLTLGATRFAAAGEDSWKFSLMPQVGVKIYTQGKFALRLHARFPITWLNGGFALGFGSGGSYASIDGTGTIGADLGGGITFLIG